MGAPVGNKNATKNKPWEDALRRALLADDGQKLRNIAEKVVAKAEEGDMAAIREIGDRLDGKANQSISGPDGGPIQHAVDGMSTMDKARAIHYAMVKASEALKKAKKSSESA